MEAAAEDLRFIESGGAFSFFLLWLFSVIGYLILGFGSATYTPRR